jgi:hypothetical protein
MNFQSLAHSSQPAYVRNPKNNQDLSRVVIERMGGKWPKRKDYWFQHFRGIVRVNVCDLTKLDRLNGLDIFSILQQDGYFNIVRTYTGFDAVLPGKRRRSFEKRLTYILKTCKPEVFNVLGWQQCVCSPISARPSCDPAWPHGDQDGRASVAPFELRRTIKSRSYNSLGNASKGHGQL